MNMTNLQRLGNVFDGRMKKTSGAAVPTTIEFGKINNNLSLTTDSLNSPIPKGEYMVDIRLSGTSYKTSETTIAGVEGSHEHELTDPFRALEDGDRVLVAWCGNEPVVIAIIVAS